MPRIPRVARQTTFFLFPILIIPVLDMESPQRDPRTPTLPTTIHEGPDSMHAETDYHIQTSPIPAGPDTEQGCASGKALSVRTGHRIRPDYEQHSRTVLCHINIGRITPSMPYNYLPSEKTKR